MATLLSLVLVALATQASARFTLQPTAFIQLPDASGSKSFNNGAATKAAYDPQEKFLYVIGQVADVLHVINMTDPTNPNLMTTKVFDKLNQGLPDSIQVCRGGMNHDFLAISFEAVNQIYKAHVHMYQLLDLGTVDGPLVDIKTMVTLDSYDPKAMMWNEQCTQLVVASEGDPHELNGNFIDPKGDVEILIPDFGETVLRRTVPIDELALSSAGVRRVFQRCDSGNTEIQSSPSQDLEPKAVTVDQNGVAYIVFQENNAIGRLDLNAVTQTPTLEYFSLGTKEWTNNALDGAYEDSAISLVSRPGLRSLYQPNDIVSFELDGKIWLATADQGSVRRYNFATCRFDEALNARTWQQSQLFSGALTQAQRDKLRSDMSTNAELGRMMMSKLRIRSDGWDAISQGYDYATTFGGRGFSIMDASTMTRVYDSGDDFERYFVNSGDENERAMFNAKVGTASQPQTQLFDRASTEFGPDPTAIAVGTFDNTTRVVVIANGGVGGLYVYSVSSGPNVQFESYLRRGLPGLTWNEAYAREDGTVGEPGITDLMFIDDQGQHIVVAVSSTAGAVGFYSVQNTP